MLEGNRGSRPKEDLITLCELTHEEIASITIQYADRKPPALSETFTPDQVAALEAWKSAA